MEKSTDINETGSRKICSCMKDTELSIKEQNGYEEVNAPVNLFTGQPYLTYSVRKPGVKKEKDLVVYCNYCPFCGQAYD